MPGARHGPTESRSHPQRRSVAGVCRLWVLATSGNEWHRGGPVPRPTHLRAKRGRSWPFRSRPVGLVAHVCPQPDRCFLSWFAAVFKSPHDPLFPLLQVALTNQCGKTTGLVSMVLHSVLLSQLAEGQGEGLFLWAALSR